MRPVEVEAYLQNTICGMSSFHARLPVAVKLAAGFEWRQLHSAVGGQVGASAGTRHHRRRQSECGAAGTRVGG